LQGAKLRHLLPQPLVGLAVLAGVLDADRELARDSLQKLELIRAELTAADRVDVEDADQLVLALAGDRYRYL